MSVIIVSWNGRRHLPGCLAALAGQTFRDFETIVVDNGSTDGSQELIESTYPWVRLIRNVRNVGFAAGNNLGIRASQAPYVVTLNNDTNAEPTWLEELVGAADRDPSLGSVASKMVFAHDPSTINSCGIALDPVGIAWDLWGGYPSDLIARPRKVFGPCAGAALYRRAMLDDVGLFDEDYFAYLEDVDLAWRARLRGWDSILAPQAVVKHAHSGTLGEGSPLKRYLLARNKVWTVVKCAPEPDAWSRFPLIATYDAGAAAFGVARQRDWASVRGRLAALASLPAALEKRREIQSRRTVSAQELREVYAQLAAPWDVPRRYRHLVPARDPVNPAENAESPVVHEASWRERVRRLGLTAAGAVLRRGDTRTTGATPRIVVLRPDHLGDVLLSRPAVELLRRALPDSEIMVIAGPWGVPSLQGVDARIETFEFPGFTRAPKAGPLAPYDALRELAARLRRDRYDAALVLRPDHWWGALAAALAGIPVRVGHATPDTTPFLTHTVHGSLSRPAAELALDAADTLLRALGTEAPAADRGARSVRFEPTQTARDEVDTWMAQQLGRFTPLPDSFDGLRAGSPPQGGWGTPPYPSLPSGTIVALHPGAGAAVKTWPARRWVAVCADLPQEWTIVITAGTGEADLARAIVAGSPRTLNVAPEWSWDALAAFYARTQLVLGMDSGPLHLAAALGTPTVRVYGPTDPRVYGPNGDPQLHHAEQAALGCVPCGNLVHPPCGFLVDPPCLAAASVDQVVEAAKRLIAQPSVLSAGPRAN